MEVHCSCWRPSILVGLYVIDSGTQKNVHKTDIVNNNYIPEQLFFKWQKFANTESAETEIGFNVKFVEGKYGFWTIA